LFVEFGLWLRLVALRVHQISLIFERLMDEVPDAFDLLIEVQHRKDLLSEVLF